MAKREYREGMDAVPGHTAAARLLNKHSGSHRGAWDSLEIFDLDTADDYLADLALKVAGMTGGVDQRAKKIIELAEMFALTSVLADRENRKAEEEFKAQAKGREDGSGDDSKVESSDQTSQTE